MRYSFALMASTAVAFPFMAPELDSKERLAMMKRTVDEALGKAAVNNAREKRQGLLGGGALGGGLRELSRKSIL